MSKKHRLWEQIWISGPRRILAQKAGIKIEKYGFIGYLILIFSLILIDRLDTYKQNISVECVIFLTT